METAVATVTRLSPELSCHLSSYSNIFINNTSPLYFYVKKNQIWYFKCTNECFSTILQIVQIVQIQHKDEWPQHLFLMGKFIFSGRKYLIKIQIYMPTKWWRVAHSVISSHWSGFVEKAIDLWALFFKHYYF